MPAGVSLGYYLRGLGASLLFMFAGAQTVHVIYTPLDDFRELVEKEKQRLREENDMEMDTKTSS